MEFNNQLLSAWIVDNHPDGEATVQAIDFQRVGVFREVERDSFGRDTRVREYYEWDWEDEDRSDFRAKVLNRMEGRILSGINVADVFEDFKEEIWDDEERDVFKDLDKLLSIASIQTGSEGAEDLDGEDLSIGQSRMVIILFAGDGHSRSERTGVERTVIINEKGQEDSGMVIFKNRHGARLDAARWRIEYDDDGRSTVLMTDLLKSTDEDNPEWTKVIDRDEQGREIGGIEKKDGQFMVRWRVVDRNPDGSYTMRFFDLEKTELIREVTFNGIGQEVSGRSWRNQDDNERFNADEDKMLAIWEVDNKGEGTSVVYLLDHTRFGVAQTITRDTIGRARHISEFYLDGVEDLSDKTALDVIDDPGAIRISRTELFYHDDWDAINASPSDRAQWKEISSRWGWDKLTDKIEKIDKGDTVAITTDEIVKGLARVELRNDEGKTTRMLEYYEEGAGTINRIINSENLMSRSEVQNRDDGSKVTTLSFARPGYVRVVEKNAFGREVAVFEYFEPEVTLKDLEDGDVRVSDIIDEDNIVGETLVDYNEDGSSTARTLDHTRPGFVLEVERDSLGRNRRIFEFYNDQIQNYDERDFSNLSKRVEQVETDLDAILEDQENTIPVSEAIVEHLTEDEPTRGFKEGDTVVTRKNLLTPGLRKFLVMFQLSPASRVTPKGNPTCPA